jgi:MerR family transcriptional regulator, copper efflux regulator
VVDEGLLQIGQVAERTQLSIRTIRYYEELELVVPSSRTAGGFRLYTEGDVDRLRLIKHMKPLEFTLEEMRDLLKLRDQLATAGRGERRRQLSDRMQMYVEAADQRCRALRTQLATAESLAAQLRNEIHVGSAGPA